VIVALNCLFPKIVTGGLLLIDDYGVFPGETRAVEEYFQSQPVDIKKLPFADTPHYVRKT